MPIVAVEAYSLIKGPPPRHTGPPDVHTQSRPRDPTTLFGPLSHPVFPAISRPRTSPSPPPSPSIMCKITSWVEDFSTREPDEASPLIACRRGAAMGDSCRAPTGCICARMSGILAQSPTLEVRWVACTACDRSCPPRPPRRRRTGSASHARLSRQAASVV